MLFRLFHCRAGVAETFTTVEGLLLRTASITPIVSIRPINQPETRRGRRLAKKGPESQRFAYVGTLWAALFGSPTILRMAMGDEARGEGAADHLSSSYPFRFVLSVKMPLPLLCHPQPFTYAWTLYNL